MPRICEYVSTVQVGARVELEDLAEKLRAVRVRRLATQAKIAVATGVDQATISRILNGQRRRSTARLVRLEEYVTMLLREEKLPPKVQEAARSFLVRGGTETELIASIEHSADLVLGKLRQSIRGTDET